MPKPKYRRFDDKEPKGFMFTMHDESEFLAQFVGDTSAQEIYLDFDAENGRWSVNVHIKDVPKLIQVLQEVLKQSTFKE